MSAGFRIAVTSAILNRTVRFVVHQACVDTLLTVRYPLKFTLHDRLRPIGPDEARHGRRQGPNPVGGYFRVERPVGAEGAAVRIRASARFDDRSSLWLGVVRKPAAGSGPALQGLGSS